MKIKTAKLIGPALDWAVAKASGVRTYISRYEHTMTGVCILDADLVDMDTDGQQELKYSRDWSQGGPIKTKHLIATQPRFLAAGYEHPNGKWVWQARLLGENNIEGSHEQEHECELVAAMRCYVASKLGDEIELPDELMDA